MKWITFTPAELEQSIKIARQGRQLEPDNSFFDWMLAYFLFAARRDQEALAALDEGAGKPRYDSHVRDDIQAAIAVRELVRPLLMEEKAVLALSGRYAIIYHYYASRLAAAEAARAKTCRRSRALPANLQRPGSIGRPDA